MFESFWIDAAAILAVLHLLILLALRSSYRFAARCHAAYVPLDALPEKVSGLFRHQAPAIQNLGFNLIGYYDLGCLISGTRSYVADFCNVQTNDFASISVLASQRKTCGYLEFSSHFPNGLILETNTNRILPLTPDNSKIKTFRFPEIKDLHTLLRIHRQLKERYAPGLWAQGETPDAEIQRLVQVVENYGPRHVHVGYMQLAEDGQSYKLTWKGAFLITLRGLWPVQLVRRLIYRRAMNSELHSLQAGAVTALQKA